MPIDEDKLWEIVLQGLELDGALLDDDEESDRGLVGQSLVEAIESAQAAGAPSLVRHVVAECIAMAEARSRIDWERLEAREA